MAAHAGHQVFVLPSHRRQGIGFALTVAFLRERPLKVGSKFTPGSLRLHHRAYRHLVHTAHAAGAHVHPQALALLRELRDGEQVHYLGEHPGAELGPRDRSAPARYLMFDRRHSR